jgi:dihydrofolate reductase
MAGLTTWVNSKLSKDCGCGSGESYRICCLHRKWVLLSLGVLAAGLLFSKTMWMDDWAHAAWVVLVGMLAVWGYSQLTRPRPCPCGSGIPISECCVMARALVVGMAFMIAPAFFVSMGSVFKVDGTAHGMLLAGAWLVLAILGFLAMCGVGLISYGRKAGWPYLRAKARYGHFKAIAAMSENRVIGRGQEIPWHLPGDFKWFKSMTLGQVVVMGRRTFESIGKPLPRRENVVVSRSGFAAKGVRTIGGLEEIDPAAEERAVFIAGGAQLYGEALSRCSDLYLTVVKKEVEGDVLFPEFEDVFKKHRVLRNEAEFKVIHYVNRSLRRDGTMGA